MGILVTAATQRPTAPLLQHMWIQQQQHQMQHQPMNLIADHHLVQMETRRRANLASSRQTQPLMRSRHQQLRPPRGSSQEGRKEQTAQQA